MQISLRAHDPILHQVSCQSGFVLWVNIAVLQQVPMLCETRISVGVVSA